MNNKIKQIIRRTHDNLPRIIRVWLLYLYKNYNSKIILDKELINNLVEYSNRNYDWFHLTSEEVVWMGKLGNRLNSNLWDILNPTTKEEINNFYRVVPYYIYSLSYWHMKREQRKFREQVVNYSFGDVLDYGGGPGDLSINLAKKGLNVTYTDISGTTKDFAEWLFKKEGTILKLLI